VTGDLTPTRGRLAAIGEKAIMVQVAQGITRCELGELEKWLWRESASSGMTRFNTNVIAS